MAVVLHTVVRWAKTKEVINAIEDAILSLIGSMYSEESFSSLPLSGKRKLSYFIIPKPCNIKCELGYHIICSNYN